MTIREFNKDDLENIMKKSGKSEEETRVHINNVTKMLKDMVNFNNERMEKKLEMNFPKGMKN